MPRWLGNSHSVWLLTVPAHVLECAGSITPYLDLCPVSPRPWAKANYSSLPFKWKNNRLTATLVKQGFPESCFISEKSWTWLSTVKEHTKCWCWMQKPTDFGMLKEYALRWQLHSHGQEKFVPRPDTDPMLLVRFTTPPNIVSTAALWREAVPKLAWISPSQS